MLYLKDQLIQVIEAPSRTGDLEYYLVREAHRMSFDRQFHKKSDSPRQDRGLGSIPCHYG